MSYRLLTFPDGQALARQAAADWLYELQTRAGTATTTNYGVALSGGRITKTFFEEVAGQALKKPILPAQLFKDVHFFWADERCVPPTDAESNYAMAQELLFGLLRIPPAQIHRLRGEGPEAEALKEAIGEICKIVPVSNGQPVLDMVFLGMGEDGHTASLFPGEPEAMMKDPAVYRAVTAVKPPPRRITLGYAAIAAARQAWVLISAKGKEQALKETLLPPEKTPLGRVIAARPATTIYTDVDIASFVNND